MNPKPRSFRNPFFRFVKPTLLLFALFATVASAGERDGTHPVSSGHFVQKYSSFSGDSLRTGFEAALASKRNPITSASSSPGVGVDPTFNVAVTEGSGYVSKTIAQSDGKMLAVGLFQMVNGVRTGNIARYNSDGSLDLGFNPGGIGSNAPIKAIALQTDGKILIGGDFTSFNGQALNRLARLNSDGTVDPTFVCTLAFNAAINDIVIQSDGKILVGGSFRGSGPLNRKVVRLEANGTWDQTFVPNFADIFSAVLRILIVGDKILVGGDFFQGIVRIDFNGATDSTFSTGPNGLGGFVRDIHSETDGRIIICGIFASISGTQTDSLARLNSNGTLATAFDFEPDPNALVDIWGLDIQSGGKIVAGVIFDGRPTRIIRFNTDGSIDPTFADDNTGRWAVRNIRMDQTGEMIVSGDFLIVNGQPHVRIARLDANGAVDSQYVPTASAAGSVHKIKLLSDGKILIAGSFEYVNGVRRSAVARLNPDGSLDPSFELGTGFFGDVNSFVVQPDNKIIIGGNFLGSPDFPGDSVVRINANGGFDQAMAADFGGGFVYDLALQSDGKVIVGGSLGSSNVVRVNPDGSRDHQFNAPLIGNFVFCLLIQPDGKIIVGGNLMISTPPFRFGLLRLNTDGTLDTSGFATLSDTVYALAEQADGKIIAAGQSLRRYNGIDGSPDPLNIGSGADQLIWGVSVQKDNSILIGGDFSSYNGSLVNHVARLNNDGSLDSSFNTPPGASGTVYAFETQSDGKIIVGGTIFDFDGKQRFGIVRLQEASSARPRADFDADGKTDLSVYRSSDSNWYVFNSGGGTIVRNWGLPTDVLTPGDFDGDGKADAAAYRPSTGQWYVLRSSDSSVNILTFGVSGDIPAAGDYDGDGKADEAVFRPSTGVWYVYRSSDGGVSITSWGANGDVPVASDYDGDGKYDVGVFRPSNGVWYVYRTTAGPLVATWGVSTDKPVQADYDGDGKTDLAIYRPSEGNWYVYRSTDNGIGITNWGNSTDTPAPGDFDGDGKYDYTVFRDGTWYIYESTAGPIVATWGIPGDVPIPSRYIPEN
jgi:uncharacterized delta-60 repeat protein